MLAQEQFSDTKHSEVLFITPHAKVHDALDLMAEKQVRLLPIMEGGRVVGMVCSSNAVSAVLASGQDNDPIFGEEIIGNWYE